ncbi:MAG: hypothetical protein LQ340_000328 [Diploschistes diacapsis]|nr:MAG: hypothetical protein LQ340_000328 [Diploschistes diacapsis]
MTSESNKEGHDSQVSWEIDDRNPYNWSMGKRVYHAVLPALFGLVVPLIGGFAVVGENWRWTEWIILFFAVFTYLLALRMDETYKKTILARAAKKTGEKAPPGTSGFAALKFVFHVYETVYDFDLQQVGLTFISIAIGSILSALTVIPVDRLVYEKRHAAWKAQGAIGRLPAEHRLYAAMLGSFGLPVYFGTHGRHDLKRTGSALSLPLR